MTSKDLHTSPLGKTVAYTTQYDPSLLFPLERAAQRQQLSLPKEWYGQDVWHAYELSWLAPNGCPRVAIGRFVIPHDSPNLIESKSLKLYLNSFNETTFESTTAVQETLSKDLSATAQAPVMVQIFAPHSAPTLQPVNLGGILIDEAPFSQRHPAPHAGLLRCHEHTVQDQTLVSHLLKSNCLITEQPDWGSLLVTYSGPEIDQSSLLEYIVSYRSHNEFHEHCVERIFADIWQQCQPQKLFVQALYTRRGGLDINPWRSSEELLPAVFRSIRQ